jgi:coenzyme F420 hydrogenase subunit beta
VNKRLAQSFEQTLANIVLSESCTGCAACVIACPFNCLKYVKEQPQLIGECEACGICSKACPRYHPSRRALEKLVFGRKRKAEEEFGIYQRVIVARSTDERILGLCQDGGVVTTLLTLAVKDKKIDGAAVSATDENKPLHPVPTLATTPQQILQSAGTKYFYSPNLLALQKGVEQDIKKLALVGTPCQIESIRRIQTIPLKKYVEKLRLTIGLMCSGAFSYEGLVENHIKRKLGINPSDITKINIKDNLLLTMNSGETETIPLKKMQRYIRASCLPCADFSAELADVSVGGLGLNGWSLVIIRTETAEKLFTAAVNAELLEVKPIEKEKRSLDLLIKLSRRQRTKHETV